MVTLMRRPSEGNAHAPKFSSEDPPDRGESTPPEEFAVYTIGLCYASVCTSLPDVEEIVARLNRVEPTGVGPWRIADEPFRDGSANPHPCESRPKTHGHFLFSC